MKYVIWGAGDRGKRILFHIEEQSVMAFIDTDRSKKGTSYLDKLIIDFDDYFESYREYPIVISYLGEQTGINFLEQNGINDYFLLSECPSEFQEPNTRNLLKEFIRSVIDENKHYGVFGCSVYSLKVYDWISDTCSVSPILVIDEETMAKKGEVLTRYGYDFVLSSEIEHSHYDKIFICEESERAQVFENQIKDDKKIDRIFDCSDRIVKYYNPYIEIFKGKHKGEKCFIVATGPSLRMEDLETLKKYNIPCFSMNHIWRAFDRTTWRPKYYVATDYRMFRDCTEIVLNIDAETAFLGDSHEGYWTLDRKENHYRFHESYEFSNEKLPKFSEDASKRIYLGYTVTYACMQIAAYMGFEEIYLLGVDFSYENEKNGARYGHFFQERAFHSVGYVNQVRMAYEGALKYANSHQLKIYNATRGGKLEIFPRVDFDTLF